MIEHKTAEKLAQILLIFIYGNYGAKSELICVANKIEEEFHYVSDHSL